MKARHWKPVTLFEPAHGFLTDEQPDLGREEHLSPGELD